jgi:hypothetical protein
LFPLKKKASNQVNNMTKEEQGYSLMAGSVNFHLDIFVLHGSFTFLNLDDLDFMLVVPQRGGRAGEIDKAVRAVLEDIS